MKYSFSLATVPPSPAAQWYWNEISEMAGVCGYEGMEIPFEAWSFNGGRGGAPICAEAIRTKFGSVARYVDFLRGCGLSGLSGLHISAQNVLATMLEYNVPRERIHEKLYELARETIGVLSEGGSDCLVLSPSPMLALLRGVYAGSDMLAAYPEEIKKTVVRIADAARAAGIRLYIRNEFWGLLRGARVADFLRELPDHVGFSPDLAQLHIAGADTAGLIRAFAGRLGCVKFSDSFFIDKIGCYATDTPEYPQQGMAQRVYCGLGNGDVELAGLFRALADTGYDDWIVLESKDSFNVEKALMKMQAFRRRRFDPILAERRKVNG